MNNNTEVWKDIQGYEGLYQVSNLGRVKSLTKNVIMKQHLGRNGYFQLNLFKDHKHHPCDVHKLVAKAFIPNPKHLSCINHLDETKTNNNVNNLEWCSKSYNNSYNNRAIKIGIKQRNGNTAKKVAQYTLDGKFIKEWPSTMECQRHGFISTSVCACCNGRRKTHKGYIWKYVE